MAIDAPGTCGSVHTVQLRLIPSHNPRATLHYREDDTALRQRERTDGGAVHRGAGEPLDELGVDDVDEEGEEDGVEPQQKRGTFKYP